jgi:multiple sugar transport system substrate-binding protein
MPDGAHPTLETGRFSRRSMLKATAGLAGLAAVPGLAACGSGGGSGGSASGTVTFGSNQSDPTPKKAYAAFVKDFEKSNKNLDVKVNTVDHETFQNQINNYLQGTPDDVFTWFAGFRMNFFASKGLAGQLDDVWQDVGSNFSSALKQSSTADDGHQYFIPFDYYPWAIFYRKSLWQKNGYQVPKTLDDLVSLSKQMQKDGLEPLGFADKQGWPAMGTFDILNMRLNGYDFHKSLMAGKEAWTDNKVKQVFTTWKDLLPYHQEGALGRDWQEAAQGLVRKELGMMLLGSFIGEQFTNPADHDDLDFFAFPEVNQQFGQDSVDAPIDGFMLSKQPRNVAGAKQLLEFLGSSEAANIWLGSNPNDVGAPKDTDTSKYTSLQKKAAEIIGSAKNIAQFLDRDTRPDFASTVMIPSIQQFLKSPDDLDPLLKSMEDQKNSIFIG